MRYLIRDKAETPQGFPLLELFQLLLNHIDTPSLKLWIYRSEGFGLLINQWDKCLGDETKLLIEPEVLLEICRGIDEWFYNLDAEIETDNLQLRFGVHDSSAIYLEASEEYSESIARIFEHVEINNN